MLQKGSFNIVELLELGIEEANLPKMMYVIDKNESYIERLGLTIIALFKSNRFINNLPSE